MKNKIFIITGRQGSGKTTFLSRIVIELNKSRIQTGGFLAEGFWIENERSHFELADLSSNERILFCTREMQNGWEKYGHFYVNPLALQLGEKILEPARLNRFHIAVIDEIGPFELKGKGWYQAIFRIAESSIEKPMIWVVRENLVQHVIDHFGLDFFTLIRANPNRLKGAVNKILNVLTKKDEGPINH